MRDLKEKDSKSSEVTPDEKSKTKGKSSKSKGGLVGLVAEKENSPSSSSQSSQATYTLVCRKTVFILCFHK